MREIYYHNPLGTVTCLAEVNLYWAVSSFVLERRDRPFYLDLNALKLFNRTKMPVDRTPPPKELSEPMDPIQSCQSDNDLRLSEEQIIEQSEHHNTLRTKRKHGSHILTEMKALFADLKREQNGRIDKLCAAVEEIKNQITDIRASVEYLSKSYDSLKEQINTLEVERHT